MAATKRQFNWSGVGFTPSGGSLLSATGVTGVTIDPGGSVQKFSGDADHGPTTIVSDFEDITVTVTLADEIWANTLAIGSRGTLVATHKDAKNATGGAITFTLVNAVVVNTQLGGQHRQFGQATVTFNAEWADSVTVPLSSSLA